ncbi:hypothetical protein GCM10008018_53280 [Paenibacillus marchantiophytorum]|uniref:Uncharacterized protein n=1 Tax=Paenibacillus marchantiophytorum TaxID=1619310 RepID=A0ABQ1F6I0_9BACL|nr:hypothetical protein GCM10008018_53280 [Paenibacillus marchantiophytorum]
MAVITPSLLFEVTTLVDEMSLKIILRVESPDTFDSYVGQLKALKIDRAIQIQQQALERDRKR